jgi:hypothetical protein
MDDNTKSTPMNNQITNGLLAVIALTLIVQTIFLSTGSSTPAGVYPPGSQVNANLPSGLNGNTPAALTTPQGSPGTTPQTANPITPTFDPAAAAAQSKPAGPTTKMAFNEYDFNFGNIKQNSENVHKFSFTNTGDKPLIITDAKGSCGCTVPKYPTEPIAPGATSEIEVIYKPGTQKDQQSKSVTITANTEPSSTIIKINAFVEVE